MPGAKRTLRDDIAISIAPSFVAEMYAHSVRNNITFENIYVTAAEAAYEFADEMLKARINRNDK